MTEKGEVWTFGTSISGVLGHEKNNFYQVSEPRMINDIPPMKYIILNIIILLLWLLLFLKNLIVFSFITAGPGNMLAIEEKENEM